MRGEDGVSFRRLRLRNGPSKEIRHGADAHAPDPRTRRGVFGSTSCGCASVGRRCTRMVGHRLGQVLPSRSGDDDKRLGDTRGVQFGEPSRSRSAGSEASFPLVSSSERHVVHLRSTVFVDGLIEVSSVLDREALRSTRTEETEPGRRGKTQAFETWMDQSGCTVSRQSWDRARNHPPQRRLVPRRS